MPDVKPSRSVRIPWRRVEEGDSVDEQGARLRPWDRQPGETEVAFAAFLAYRDSGVPRNLAATARALSKYEGQLYRWKARHRWDYRLLAWDAAQGKASEETAQREWERRRHRWSEAGDHIMQALLSTLLRLIITDPETGKAALDGRVKVELGLGIGEFIMRFQRWLAEAPAGPDGPPEASSELRRMASVELEKLKQLALEQDTNHEEAGGNGKTRSSRKRGENAPMRP